jgi:hypothetical protein
MESKKNITVQDIAQNQLDVFIKKMEWYHGISSIDRCWVYATTSKPYLITLYCYLIGSANLYIESGKLKSRSNGHDKLVNFIEEYFKGKCIRNFTDLFFSMILTLPFAIIIGTM